MSTVPEVWELMLFQVQLASSKANCLARSILWGFPIPATAEEWVFPNVKAEAAMFEHFQRIEKAWDFLRPSFASQGYTVHLLIMYNVGTTQFPIH